MMLREETAVIVIEWAGRLANYLLPSTQRRVVIGVTETLHAK
jgi:hypothetical protein